MHQFILYIKREFLSFKQKIDLLEKYFHTIRYLKFSQIFFRIIKYLPKGKISKKNLPKRTNINLSFEKFNWRDECINKNNFKFLNKTYLIKDKKDWNNEKISKLWLYNLHYFDNLNSKHHYKFKQRNKKLIYKWIDENPLGHGVGWEPYPTSLRIVNWIRWMSLLKNKDEKIEISLALQLRWLNKNIEYHLQGNHLIANAKALLFGGFFFKNNEAKNWREKGKFILKKQIIEQINSDGGHFERSPMYHCIILEDMIDILNLFNSNKFISESFLENKIKNVSLLMLVWLSNVIHPDGEIPFFNDSTLGISANYKLLKQYFYNLNKDNKVKNNHNHTQLESGFATLRNKFIYCICDIGSIKPDYMPGHSHAETLSFEASFKGKRVIVNSGISNYWLTEERLAERSTKFHSTIEINNRDSSEVWSRFRVARRAKIINKNFINNSTDNYIYAEHDGYKNLDGNPIHLRLWNLNHDNLEIIDQIKGKKSCKICIRFFLHPKSFIENTNSNSLIIIRRQNKGNPIKIIMQWEYKFNLSIENTFWNKGFYRKEKNKCINLSTYSSIPFVNKTIFKLKEES